MDGLLVVDVQNDFCEGGALAVSGGSAVAEAISRHIADGGYGSVAATRDYHVDPGPHFSDTPDFARSWPPHCVAGTSGAGFHPELDVASVDAVFSKGRYSDRYSGFEGTERDGTTLAEWLRARDVHAVDVVGIATDHCVRATAIDAARAGFPTRVLLSLTAGVSESGIRNAVAELRTAGVSVVD